ncbi:hypothetical protein SAMN06272765_5692 [Streptomyces sp. Ag109_G2-15]|nr:hypothetical protein SAMN06272765_5692 [Streptomyces sp. Ag109_G2-15]
MRRMTRLTIDWSQLTHAYGPADDIPGLFARLDGGPGDEQVWHALWSALCHQGSVYSASFAALPLLTDIATGRAAGDRDEAVALAGFVVAEAEPSERPRYEDQIAELLPVARARLAEIPTGDPAKFVYHTQFLLAFEGVPFWSRELEMLLEEFEAECPHCEALTVVQVGEYVDHCEAELHPAHPADLTGAGARLHALAVDAGQVAVADWVARLFGRVTCPECETVFGLAESVVGAGAGRG